MGVCVCVFSVFLFVVLSSVKRSNATSHDIGVGNEGSRGSLASFTSRLVSSKWGLPPPHFCISCCVANSLKDNFILR